MFKMKLAAINFSGGNLGKNLGCEKAFDEILKELDKAALKEDGTRPSFSILQFKVDNSNLEQNHSLLLEQAKRLALDDTIFIGGDHSISYSLIKAFCAKTKNAGIIVFDAHPDLMPSFKPPTHDNYLRMLIEEGVVRPENIILAGVRSIDIEELKFLQLKKIRFYTMKQLQEDRELVHSIMELLQRFSAVYLSLDIDVVDPAFAPGTGYCEIGGLSSREVIGYVQKLRLMKKLKWIDLVEINPDKDINRITLKLGAKLVREAGA